MGLKVKIAIISSGRGKTTQPEPYKLLAYPRNLTVGVVDG